MDTPDPTKCPHGLPWPKCTDAACFEEMCRAEEAATCPHGFLVGCPVCIAEHARANAKEGQA